MAATVIGRGITIEGEVTSSDEVIIAGAIRGTLSVDGQVTIEPDGVVEADVSGHAVSIAGTVTGNVSAAERVDLLGGSRLVGDVKAAKLTIAEGATFKGNVDMDV